jgi:hypothetical protein
MAAAIVYSTKELKMIILFWICISIIVGIYASRLNRNGFGWFIASIFISPLLAWLFLLAIGSHKNTDKEETK